MTDISPPGNPLNSIIQSMHDTRQRRQRCEYGTFLPEEVKKVTYKNATGEITLEEAQRLYEKHNICVIVDEGRHVTLADEYHPLAVAR